MERNELEKLTPEELMNLSESNTSDFRWNRSDIYKVAFEKYEKNGDKESLENMRKELLIFDLSTHNFPKKRFDAMMSGTTDKGEEWKYPDLEKHFSKESIDYYKNRANTTSNPILKARYSDVIWEHNKDVNYACLAISAYLNCCPIYFSNEWDDELADALGRAIAIALIINNQNLINESLKKHYEFVGLLVKKRRFRFLIEIIGSILRQEEKIKGTIDCDYLISVIEMAIVDYSQKVSYRFHIQRSCMDIIEKIWKIRKNENKRRETKVRIAESFVEEAEWKKVNNPSGNKVAAHFYEKSMQVYMELGNLRLTHD